MLKKMGYSLVGSMIYILPLPLFSWLFSGSPKVVYTQHILYWKPCVLLREPSLIFEDYVQELNVWLLIQNDWQLISLNARSPSTSKCMLPALLMQAWVLCAVLALTTLVPLAISQLPLTSAYFCFLQPCFLHSSASSLTVLKWRVINFSLWWQKPMPD